MKTYTEAERKAALAEIARRKLLSEGKAISLETPPLWFHKYQVEAWNSDRFITAICAGWQSGKTVYLAPWLLREIQRKGPGDYGAFSSTYKLLSRKFLPELRKAFRQYAEYRSSDMQFVFTEDGSRKLWGGGWNGEPTVIQLGYAENPDSLESATLKAVVWDEPGQRLVPEQSFLTVHSRLMVNQGRMCLASRPYEFGWYQRLVQGKDPDVTVVQFPSWANPVNPKAGDAYWQKLKDKLPAWQFSILYEGKFERPAGAIFDNFDYARHVVKQLKVPSDWPRRAGLDFGGINTAAVLGAIEKRPVGGPRMVIHAEYWPKTARDEKDHANAIIELSGAVPYAYGGSHQESGWRTAYTLVGLPVYEPNHSGPGSVEVRIQAIYSALQDGSLVITENCTQLIDQISNYTRKVEDGEVIDEIDDKAAFHLCFVAGTLVETESGQRPIESICPGDSVWTRKGLRVVTSAKATGLRDVSTLVTTDGRRLIGTNDHPIWCNGRWVRMDSLGYSDTLEVWQPEKQLSTAIGNGIVTQSHPACRIEGISSLVQATCTAKYGLTIMARYLTGLMSTIRTRITTITSCLIWNCCPRVTIAACTTSDASQTINAFIWKPFGIKQRSGTDQTRDANGTLNTQPKRFRPANLSGEFANTAAENTGQCRTANRTHTVPEIVRHTLGVIAELTTCKFIARFVGQCLRRINIQQPSAVRVSAVVASGKQNVYNLTVDDAHEYYANGILVSNCDALGYLMLAPKPTEITMSSRVSIGKPQEWDEDDEDRPKPGQKVPKTLQQVRRR